jgi:hypothetical protein
MSKAVGVSVSTPTVITHLPIPIDRWLAVGHFRGRGGGGYVLIGMTYAVRMIPSCFGAIEFFGALAGGLKKGGLRRLPGRPEILEVLAGGICGLLSCCDVLWWRVVALVGLQNVSGRS